MRTVRDEAFFELRPLKHKVMKIGMGKTMNDTIYCVHAYTCNVMKCVCMYVYHAAQRYGITEITDDFLVLLSHGVQVCILTQLYSCTCVSVCLSVCQIHHPACD